MKQLKVKIFCWIGICAAAISATAKASVISPTTHPSTFIVRQWIPAGFHAIRDVPYAPRASRSQTLDVYVPDLPAAPRPLMIWIHGGGWATGHQAAPPGMGLLLRGDGAAGISC